MDFTPLYPLTSPSHLLFSPGSTFLLSLVTHDDPSSSYSSTGAPTATLVVRAASDLSLVRSWPLALGGGEAAGVALGWSPDGGYILVSNPRRGTVDVYVLDPRRQPVFSTSTDDSEQSGEAQAVAHLDHSSTGGFVQACWAPGSGLVVPPAIFCFAGEDVGVMTAYCLASAGGGGSDDSAEREVSRTRSAVFRDVKKSRCWPHPSDKGRFALLHRDIKSGVEKVGIYRAVVSKDDTAAGAPTSSGSGRSSAGAYTAILQGKSTPTHTGPTVDWELETSFPCHTNDAAGLAWSPDGNLIAVWEGPLEYRLHVFTALGALRGTLAHSGEAGVSGVRVREPMWTGMPGEEAEGEAMGMGNEASSSSSPRLGASLRASTTAASRSTRSSARTASGQGDATGLQQDGATTLATAAAGGLGIRTVSWRPTSSSNASTSNGRRPAPSSIGNTLTITGFDERIYLLSQETTTGQWHLIAPPSPSPSTTSTTTPSSLAHLDLIRRPLTSPLPRARIYREPRDWVTLTGGRGIVPFHSSPLTLSGGSGVHPPTLKPDWEKLSLGAVAAAAGGSGSGARAGVQWMEWDPVRGQYVAVRSESMPSTVLVYELQEAAGTSLQLLSVLLFASSVSSVAWRPASTVGGEGQQGQGQPQPQLSIVTSASPAIYLWTLPPPPPPPHHHHDADQAAPIVEGVPVPVPATAPLSGTTTSAMDFRPSALRWSPDGGKVAVASAREGATGGMGAFCVATHAEDEDEGESEV